jgi:hypothetical protein
MNGKITGHDREKWIKKLSVDMKIICHTEQFSAAVTVHGVLST